MDIPGASPSQLYALIQNDQLDAAIRKSANDEFTRRQLSVASIEQIVREFDQQYKPLEEEGLSSGYKVFLIALPALFTISLFAVVFFNPLNGKKRKDAIFYSTLGYGLWAVGIIVFAYLNRTHAA